MIVPGRRDPLTFAAEREVTDPLVGADQLIPETHNKETQMCGSCGVAGTGASCWSCGADWTHEWAWRVTPASHGWGYHDIRLRPERTFPNPLMALMAKAVDPW